MSADVRPGQIWADNDWRSAGRTLRVIRVDDTHATCVVVTNDRRTQALVHAGQRAFDRRGKETRILLRRFRPNSTGYELLGNEVAS